MVNANLQVAHSRDGIGGVFNVGQGKAYTLLDLIELLEKVLGREIKCFHTQGRPGDVRHTLADISQGERRFGYRPKVSFEEGITRTVEYFGREISIGFHGQLEDQHKTI